jgi:hypothetical protein
MTSTYFFAIASGADVEFDMPLGKLTNNKGGSTGGGTFYGNGNRKYIFRLNEIYSYQSSNFIHTPGSLDFRVKKVSCGSNLISALPTYTNDINIDEFVCLISNSRISDSTTGTNTFNITLISGAGSFSFYGGRYNIGNITTTGTCTTSPYTTYINFKNSIISSGGGINIGSNGNASYLTIITGNISTQSAFGLRNQGGGLGNSNTIKFLNFSTDLGSNTFSTSGSNLIFENCVIKSTNSPITLTGGATYSNSYEIKNSIFEVVNAVPLVTGGASGTNTLKIAGVSTNATMLSDQNGTGVTVNVIGKISVADGVDSKDAVNKGQLDSASGSAGSYTATGTATTTFTVTIGTTQADALYKVTASPSNALSAVMFYINNKTTTTFDVVFVTGLTGAVAFDWILKP